MAVDPYRLPRLRRAVVSTMALELRLQRSVRAVRDADAWTVAGIVLAVLALSLHSWIELTALVAVLLLKVAAELVDWRRHALVRVEETDSLSGLQFERWLERFFAELGFAVERTPERGDYGADLIVTWNGVRTAVQAKCGHQNAGVAAVQQVVAAK